MILLLDVGNTHTHLGLADGRQVRRRAAVRTAGWADGGAAGGVTAFIGRARLEGVAWCSVVPGVNGAIDRWIGQHHPAQVLRLDHRSVRGVGIRYPRPATIGADRLANAVAVRRWYGAPSVAVDFGTAVTFDVVDGQGDYVGGVIAPGLSAMTDYLHEKTALLPRIRIRAVERAVGRSTREAMLIGAVAGYRGLVEGVLRGIRDELGVKELPVVVTGGCGHLVAHGMPGVQAVMPELTLEGLRLVWEAHFGERRERGGPP